MKQTLRLLVFAIFLHGCTEMDELVNGEDDKVKYSFSIKCSELLCSFGTSTRVKVQYTDWQYYSDSDIVNSFELFNGTIVDYEVIGFEVEVGKKFKIISIDVESMDGFGLWHDMNCYRPIDTDYEPKQNKVNEVVNCWGPN